MTSGVRLTTEEFIKRAKEKHGNSKYDYSRVEYINARAKVKIICPIHGEFEQPPYRHLMGGCKKCGHVNTSNKQRLGAEEFIKRAIRLHNEKYDYSLTDYINNQTKVKIICPDHGEFEQAPSSHISNHKHGCPKCAKISRSKTRTYSTKNFINLSREVHGKGKYDYSKVEYVGSQAKVKIICPEHGEFEQAPTTHLSGRGCMLCGRQKVRDGNKLTINQFITRANIVHNEKYDYSKVVYKNTTTKTKIICPYHGEYEQTPGNHLQGKRCPNCANTGGYSYSYFDKYPEAKPIPAMVYLISFVDQETRDLMLKIGITKHTLLERYRKDKLQYTTILEQDAPLYECFDTEQMALLEFSEFRQIPEMEFNGWSECFSHSSELERQMIQYIQNRLV